MEELINKLLKWNFEKCLPMTASALKYITGNAAFALQAVLLSHFFLIDWRKHLKNNWSVVILQRTFLWIFGKWLMKTSKKNPFISQHAYLYVWVTDILKFSEVVCYEAFWSFILQMFALFLESSHYAYSPLYMHKTLPILRNEKEQQQIKFYKKLLGEVISSQVTKNLKMICFTCPTGWVIKK